MKKTFPIGLLVAACATPGISLAAINNVGTATAPTTNKGSSYKAYNGAAQNLNGMNLDYVTMGVSRAGVIVGAVATPTVCQNNIEINHTNFHLIAPTTGSNLPVGFSIICGSNITIENSTATGFKMVPVTSKYANGDGESSEVGATNITLRNNVMSNNSDGCFDNKASNLLLDGNTAQTCHYGFRIWGKNVTGTTNTCIDFQEACVQFSPGAANVTLAKQVIVPGAINAPVFQIYAGVTNINVLACEVQDGQGHVITTGLKLTWTNYQSGATAAKDGVNVHLGPTCSNTPPIVVQPPPVVVSALQVFYPTALVDKSGNGSVSVTTTAIWKAMGLKGPTTLALPPTPCTNDKGAQGYCYTVKP